MDEYTLDGDPDLRFLNAIGAGDARRTAYTGTKALFLAVLEDGIRGYLSPVRQVRAEAEFWVSSMRQRSPFSFIVICETLGLEPGAVRRALRNMRARRLPRRQTIRRARPNVRRSHRIVRQAG